MSWHRQNKVAEITENVHSERERCHPVPSGDYVLTVWYVYLFTYFNTVSPHEQCQGRYWPWVYTNKEKKAQADLASEQGREIRM